jgi:Xaa-Pro aminopeptidase
MNKDRFKFRINQAKKLLLRQLNTAKLQSGAIIISSAAQQPLSRDQFFPFRQNSNFLYLLGSHSLANACLIISSTKDRPILVACLPTKEQIVWEGAGEDIKNLCNLLGIDFINSSKVEAETLRLIQNLDLIFCGNEAGTISLKIAEAVLKSATHQRAGRPQRIIQAEVIMEELRLFKSSDEVELIKHANNISNTALLCALPFIKAGKTEAAIAATLEYGMKLQQAESAFATIVASGKNAAVLHHRASETKIKKGQMLLFDWGSRFDGYCSDISRCLVVESPFSSIQKEIYEIVLSAQLAAIKKVKDGALVQSIYSAAVKELSIGLKELGVIKAPLARIIDKKLYKRFFPHGIGHTLGLDVHDIGQMRADSKVVLKKGMVITIEPGLYFSKATKKIPACGVRIEDNLLVGKNSATILSEGFPKEVKKIEALV